VKIDSLMKLFDVPALQGTRQDVFARALQVISTDLAHMFVRKSWFHDKINCLAVGYNNQKGRHNFGLLINYDGEQFGLMVDFSSELYRLTQEQALVGAKIMEAFLTRVGRGEIPFRADDDGVEWLNA